MSKNSPILPGIETSALVLIFVLMTLPFSSKADESASDSAKPALLSRLFQSHDTFSMRLEAPFKKLEKKRGDDRPYAPAELKYKDNAGEEVRLGLKIRLRGKYRAKKDVCRFPPFKLNFDKKGLKGTLFDGEDKLKLVTHCQRSKKYEQFVLLEYLNYRMQNQLTEYSLRARLASVEYYDTDTKKIIDTKFGFFIEDKGKMAARVDTETILTERIETGQYDQDILHLATIFEYMIANTDFSVVLGPGDECCHNIIPLKTTTGVIVPVPYDFDGSGIVNPPYLSPPEHLGIRSTRQRLYRGYCQNTAGFKKSFEVFHENKDAIMALYNNQTGLNSRTLKRTLAYLEKFYETISDDDKIVSEFIDKCRS